MNKMIAVTIRPVATTTTARAELPPHRCCSAPSWAEALRPRRPVPARRCPATPRTAAATPCAGRRSPDGRRTQARARGACAGRPAPAPPDRPSGSSRRSQPRLPCSPVRRQAILPARNAHTLGNLVSRLVVARHGRRGGPGEVVVQHLPERGGLFQADVLHRLVETGDRPAVHLLVRAVAAVEIG